MSKEIEIEKKYKVKKMPNNLEKFESMIIEQSYINKGGAPIRLRKIVKDNKISCIFSKKVRKNENSIECIEHNIELSEKLYEEFLDAKEGRTIIKTRYIIPLENELKIELDVFHDFFEGVCIAEIEYKSVKQANSYKIPAWLGEEITNLRKVTNLYMATEATDILEYNDLIE